jgi:hypothetical protein
VASGRFEITDIEVVVTSILGGSLALMRSIVDGRLGKGAEVAFAEISLRSLGVPISDAAQIVRREMT